MRNNHNRVPDFNSFHTHPGDHEKITYSSKYRPDGTVELTESGRTNIQAEINSHLAETDMAIIIQKLQYGDTSVLTHKPASYGDFTQFPTTYAEMLNLVQRSEKVFDDLSTDVKAKFDNDRFKWFSAIGSPSWLDAMGLSPAVDVPAPVNNSEVD